MALYPSPLTVREPPTRAQDVLPLSVQHSPPVADLMDTSRPAFSHDQPPVPHPTVCPAILHQHHPLSDTRYSTPPILASQDPPPARSSVPAHRVLARSPHGLISLPPMVPHLLAHTTHQTAALPLHRPTFSCLPAPSVLYSSPGSLFSS